MRIIFVLLALMVSGSAAAANDHGFQGPEGALPPGPAQVVDGDSLVIAGRKVRLEGIDAPEWKQTCPRDGAAWPAGREATAWLRSRLAGRIVACAAQGRDRYGRTLAHCFVDGENINAALVRAGYAWAYTRYSNRYVAEERAARKAGRGVWGAACEPPEDWRRAHPWKPKGRKEGG